MTVNAQLARQLGLTLGVNKLFDVYPDKIYVDPRNNPSNFSVNSATSYSFSLDNLNRGRYLYSANQFGFNGAYYFGRLNIAL